MRPYKRKTRETQAADMRVLIGQASVPGSGIDHGSLAGLSDDDHPQYGHLSQAETVTGQWAFDPAGAVAPFTIGATNQDITVTGLRADSLNKNVTAGNGLTGGGALSGNVTLTLGTPGTLTVSTANGVTATSHTHAITTSDDVGAGGAAILASDASGYLTVARLKAGGGGNPSYPLHIAGEAYIVDRMAVGAGNPSSLYRLYTVDQWTTDVTLNSAGWHVLAQIASTVDVTNPLTAIQATARSNGSTPALTQNTLRAFYGYTRTYDQGSYNNLFSYYGWVDSGGQASTISSMRGLHADMYVRADTVDQVYGLRTSIQTLAGSSVTGATSLYIAATNFAASTVNTAYGIFIGNVVNATSNYAIYSTAGTVSLGDSLQFRQAAVISTTSGNLTLQPAGDVTLDPTGNDVLPGTGYDINLGSLQKKYLTLHAAELWVETLVAQDTVATIGGRVVISPTTILEADLGTGDTTIYVKHNELASGDIVWLEADGKLEFMSIDSAPGGAGPYSYTVTRNLDGTGANLWYAGDAVVNTGTTGQGFIDLYSVHGISAPTQYGPAIVGNVRNSSTYNDWTEHWAIGNLNGVYGVGTDRYGAGFGKYATDSEYVLVTDANGVEMYSNNSRRVHLYNAGLDLGVTSTEHLNITTSAITFYGNDGVTAEASLSGSTWTLGRSAAAHTTITTTAISMYDSGAVQRVSLTTNAFWIGASSTTERLAYDTTNGVRIMNHSNAAVIQFPTSGNAKIVGTLDLSSPGVLTAGSVTLDPNGVEIEVGASEVTNDSYKIKNTSGDLIGSLTGWATGGINSVKLQAVTTTGYDGQLNLVGTTGITLSLTSGAYTIDLRDEVGTSRLLLQHAGGINLTGPVAASSTMTVVTGLRVGSWATAPSSGDILHSGNLRPYRNSTLYTAYSFVPLTTPLTNTSWDGDSKSDVATSTAMNLNTLFGVPKYARAVLMQVVTQDSIATRTDGLYFSCGPTSTYWYALASRPVAGDVDVEAQGIVPCTLDGSNNPTIYYRINASGTNTLDVWIWIWGYFI